MFFQYKMRYLVVSKKKESIIRVRMGWKNPSLTITLCHHSASLVMPISDPQDGFFYPNLTLMMNSYIHNFTLYNFVYMELWYTMISASG